MKRHLSEPTNERPISIEEDKDRPNLDPIRDDPLMIREPRKKTDVQMGEYGQEEMQYAANNASRYCENAYVLTALRYLTYER